MVLQLPDWVESFVRDQGSCYPEVEERMRLAIALAQLNVEHGSGGPFGAAVFEMDSGRLLAPGVNVVVPAGCSVAHAEMMALMVAQRVVGNFDLGGEGLPAYELVTSAEPCAMCFGAVPWSGVRRLVCGARAADVQAIGFDEGPKMADWVAELERRGIAVLRDVCRAEARQVLTMYKARGGLIYNGRGG